VIAHVDMSITGSVLLQHFLLLPGEVSIVDVLFDPTTDILTLSITGTPFDEVDRPTLVAPSYHFTAENKAEWTGEWHPGPQRVHPR
jgi:hypothetical protein